MDEAAVEKAIDDLERNLCKWTINSSWEVWRDERSLCFIARNDEGRTLLGYRTYDETYFDWRDRLLQRKSDDAKR